MMANTQFPQSSPSPLMGEGARRADEGEARITGLARSLRRNSTDFEKQLWELLRDRRLVGFKFRRQVPIGPYIADFACYDAKLVVELDGSQHFGSGRDKVRDAELIRRGFEVIRVWNSEVNDNRDGVLEAVHAALVRRAGSPSSALRAPSPIKGEGDPREALYLTENDAAAVPSPSPLMGEGGQRPD